MWLKSSSFSEDYGAIPVLRPCERTEDARAGEWLDWVKERHPEAYDNVLATIWPTKIPEIQRYGEERVNDYK